ncbi:hypothetical protein PHYBLDRAFT_69648 [Phycomyces blakesleeanus NRRL 1555(-)]|uniref:C2 domain-containing protein n=1 Tax=Phycomyces blakesleeanus (strain ATCC 8743b / DSM 1359 / FGSC 10004 / NBRC 33097 / NRRL 1555) TaxID=763407 RepID=A0A163EFW6_PHYB8|nr:hypothetical protein PHYBLDRAFT_69648 [Phycomyces blakesleeanus NRRL 1555(-)]OAD78410.1 hypothetical protein PHYBLDRAFT_69648 [Phycomyces blakesleeanus NRRL 1555(-)]|eukprot:XP_018296450.1 hypothetical protein PHYBLDRAFT_69648 [Phycomyces blakesleeanus NRRL 1555(-)]
MEIKSTSTLRRGGGGAKRATRTLNPTQVYDYALRCAIRACIEQSGPQPVVKEPKKERQSVHIGVGDVFGSITDKFGEESKPDKLTKEIVRGLMRRVDDISKAKDTSKAEYQDKRFLTVISQFQKVLLQHRYKPTGTVNDLVIIFLKTSEVELKRANPNPAIWYEELNRYIAIFAELVIQTVQEDAPSAATPELMEKLNGFVGPSKSAAAAGGGGENGKSGAGASGGRRAPEKKPTPGAPSSPLPSGSIEALENFPMVKTVQSLFQMDDADHRKKLRELQPICTESALLLDLKKCINNVHTNQPFPGRREDFPSQQMYDNWQKRELKQLTELMKTLMLMNPKLSLGAGSETDVGSSNLLAKGPTRRQGSLTDTNRSSIYNIQEDVPLPSPRTESLQSPFTYVPNDPRSFFRLLMNMCIDYDTKVTPDAERAKTSVLSQQSDELLRECWKTWRLTSPYRAVLYLELVKTRFELGELDFEDIRDATRALDKAIKENDVNSWAINDMLYQNIGKLGNPEWVADLVGMLDKIYENTAYLEDHADPLQEFILLEETIEGAAVERWRYIEKVSNNPENDDLTNLLTMADKLQKELVSLSKRKFKTPIKGILSIPGIVMSRQMPYFALEIDNWAFSKEASTASIDVTFEFYQKVLSLKRLYDQHGPKKQTSLFKVESWFLQHVRRWLSTTSAATLEWVENAIKEDHFESINETAMHSSSIVDLFSMFHQAVDFVQSLQWPNDLQHCRFLTALSKVIGVAIEEYTYTLEDMITEDINPRIEHTPEVAANTSFLDRARFQLYGARGTAKDEGVPADFTPEAINDIEAARGRLDRLYQIMEVDDIAEIMREFGSPSTAVEKTENNNFLYSIKIVRAEDLQPLDKNGLSDPYVVLEINGKQITRTRTVYETLNPRWDQIFDIWLTEKAVDVLAVVYDEDMIGANEECGLVWFKLSPEYFDDYQSHELGLNLHPQGKLILRVSMEGEKDDIQFWFGKAFRTLKRAENDAAGLIVDRMGRYMRQCLSRRILDRVLGRDRSFFSAFNRATKQADITLQECEDAIAPLLDYLEKNLHVLNDHLSEANMQMVLLRVWKEILLTLECVLLPPLSEQPSEMKPLDDYEIHVVFKWLELLKILFNGGEDGDAVPIDRLETSQYYALLAINAAYNVDTETLIQDYHTVLKNQVEMKMRGGRKADRSKTVYHSKHTVRRRKTDRKSVSMDMPSSETILRILRMRPGKHVQSFLHAEFEKRKNPPNAAQQQQQQQQDQQLQIQEQSQEGLPQQQQQQQFIASGDNADVILPMESGYPGTPSEETTLPM